jgi:hypothetical protein
MAQEGSDLMPLLWERHREEFERKPSQSDQPPEWTGATAETEEKAIAARILALPA